MLEFKKNVNKKIIIIVDEYFVEGCGWTDGNCFCNTDH